MKINVIRLIEIILLLSSSSFIFIIIIIITVISLKIIKFNEYVK